MNKNMINNNKNNYKVAVVVMIVVVYMSLKALQNYFKG